MMGHTWLHFLLHLELLPSAAILFAAREASDGTAVQVDPGYFRFPAAHPASLDLTPRL